LSIDLFCPSEYLVEDGRKKRFVVGVGVAAAVESSDFGLD
jgi:hypothetical protein